MAERKKRTYAGMAWKIITLGYGGSSKSSKPSAPPATDPDPPRATVYEPETLDALRLSSNQLESNAEIRETLEACRTDQEVIAYLQRLIDTMQAPPPLKPEDAMLQEIQQTHVDLVALVKEPTTACETLHDFEVEDCRSSLNSPLASAVHFDDGATTEEPSIATQLRRRRQRPVTPYPPRMMVDEAPCKRAKTTPPPEDTRLQMSPINISIEIANNEVVPAERTVCQYVSEMWATVLRFFNF